MKRYELHRGNCLEVMRGMADNSVDAIVTDPPYGLTNRGGGPNGKGLDTPFARSKAGASHGGFMGLTWDRDVPPVEVWVECLRVLKPGGYLLAFAGTRTQHRMATRIEDAGFEIRDMIAWVYGSGFPKSRNGDWGGTALKPALEPITMARKPLIGTVSSNWAEHGTGGLNIDGCRVPIDANADASQLRTMRRSQRKPGDWGMNTVSADAPQVVCRDGRWPANLVHDGSDEVVAAFPQAGGAQAPVTGHEPTGHGFSGNVYGAPGQQARLPSDRRDGGGSATRFFYCAKASRADRNDGVGGSDVPALSTGATMREREDADWQARNGNFHPTVKPTALMRWLVRLVTPRGGTVLDPYNGSGSTGKACMFEGFYYVGIDLDSDDDGCPLGYLDISRARIEWVIANAGEPSDEQPDDETEPEVKAVTAKASGIGRGRPASNDEMAGVHLQIGLFGAEAA